MEVEFSNGSGLAVIPCAVLYFLLYIFNVDLSYGGLQTMGSCLSENHVLYCLSYCLLFAADTNECDDVICGPGGTCSTPDFNSYVCSCNTPGYHGYSFDEFTGGLTFIDEAGDCLDIDECFQNGFNGDITDCGAGATCSTPSLGSYVCSCDVGFNGDNVTEGPAICSGTHISNMILSLNVQFVKKTMIASSKNVNLAPTKPFFFYLSFHHLQNPIDCTYN